MCVPAQISPCTLARMQSCRRIFLKILLLGNASCFTSASSGDPIEGFLNDPSCLIMRELGVFLGRIFLPLKLSLISNCEVISKYDATYVPFSLQLGKL